MRAAPINRRAAPSALRRDAEEPDRTIVSQAEERRQDDLRLWRYAHRLAALIGTSPEHDSTAAGVGLGGK